MSVAPALMLGEPNSSGLSPLPGLYAVGGNVHATIHRTPYVRDVSCVGWNARSLWAHNNSETIKFALKLATNHDITILTETRETLERRIFLEDQLPPGLQLYSTGIDQFKGGVAVLVKKKVADRFCGKPVWTVIVQGRLARLEFTGPHGILHVYAIYLDPESPAERDSHMKKIEAIYDEKVHNLFIGDCNFTANASDHISKGDASCSDNTADKRNAKTWNELAARLHVKECVQNNFTCENSYGWSRIGRAYTNLHLADLQVLRCSCNVLDHPRHLSDHRPISIVFAMTRKKKRSSTIPRWATEHEAFSKELEDELEARCKDFQRREKRAPSVFEKLRLFKESAHAASGYVRRRCKDMIASTTEHKLAVHLSFLRALHEADFTRARALQRRCSELSGVPIGEGMLEPTAFQNIKDKTVELMQTDIRERAEELKKIRNQLPEEIYEHRKRGIANTLKRMLPAGTSEMAAMINGEGKVITEAGDIAACLKDYWQDVFAHKDTDCTLRRSWLEGVEDAHKVSKERLRPTKSIVRQVIKDAATSAAGPDRVPFEVYKKAGECAVELFCDLATAMLDGVDFPGECFNLAYMVCIPKTADGHLEDATPFYSAASTRPISIVDASNRLLASIFKAALEKEVGHLLCKAQKGFIKHRQMLRNVLEVDFAARKISVQSRSGAILLFDFSAAFPSLAHDMLWDTLEVAGVDADYIRAIKLFYKHNKHIMKLKGLEFEGPLVESGVRQGCPLSGLLFAIAVDVLLRKLQKHLHNDEELGAFADDIAVVVSNVWTTMPILRRIFDEFEQISALKLNIRKTVLIPLWKYMNDKNMRCLLKEYCHGFADVVIDDKR